MTQPWVTENREIVLDQAPWITVENHAVRLPNGELIPDSAWVVLPDYAIVVAITSDGRFLSFRQNKYAVDGESLAAVGGYLDDGEEPLAAAQRELREETGYEADTWIGLLIRRRRQSRSRGRTLLPRSRSPPSRKTGPLTISRNRNYCSSIATTLRSRLNGANSK